MADNNNLNEENSFYLDPNIQIKRSYSYTNYLLYNRSIDTQNNPINRKYIGQFVLGERLGEGTFGIVVLGTHQITGEKVAVKILDKEKILQETDKSRLEREIKILKNMRHNNIVHLYDVKDTPTSLYIIMEYICGKELFEYIIYNKRLSELEACKFYQQIISGIEYLGKIKVVHRDIKPENLLLDNKNNIKIVDFGLSNSYPRNQLLTTACGSPCYAAPEMINGEKYYGLKADIWSSGIVLYAMLCGYLPFEEADNEKLYKKITEGKFNTPNFLSDSAKDFLHRILNVDPKSRINIPQMKKHPWFNLINPKLNMSEGLLLQKVIVPIDENIVYKMVHEYKFNGEEVRTNLLLNKHNHITTTYFLILNQKLRNGEKTVGNMKSKEFLNYIHSPQNFLSHYGYNMKKIIELRAKNIDNKPVLEEKDIKNKRNKTSINGLSVETQSGSTGMMNVGSSIEKITRKEKRESSAVERRKNYLENKEKNYRDKVISFLESKKKEKVQNNPKSVDTKTKKKREINKIPNKEKSNKISVTSDLKIKKLNYINKLPKNKKRNTEIKNKKNLIIELKSEEKENRKGKNYILEEIEESKGANINDLDSSKKFNENNSSNKKKINKLNKKAITNKNVIHNKKNKFDIVFLEKKENERKQKIKRLIEKKNITERRIQIKSYEINKQDELNDTEKGKDELIMNTDINKYINLSKLMRRMKGKKDTSKKNNSKKNKFSLEESLKTPKIDITEREENIMKKKENIKEPITDRYIKENKNYGNNFHKKRNIIANIYNFKSKKKNNNIKDKKSLEKEKEINKINKKFIDTSISFDKTNDEIDKSNKENILLTDEPNHIEENEESDSEPAKENKTKESENKEKENEEEEFRRKEKDIKYLKLKSKHKKFNIVKNEKDNFNNSIKYSYTNNNKTINNTIFIPAFRKTKTKNTNNNYEPNFTNNKNNKFKNILLETEKLKIFNQKNINKRNEIINHHTTINNYKNYLNNSKKKFNKSLERKPNKNYNDNNKNSSNSIENKFYDTYENNIKNDEKNKIKKMTKNKNVEYNSIFDDYNENNSEKQVLDLNSIFYCKNYGDIKEIKEKIKKELDNKKVKYNLKKNKFCCYYKNENKFNLEIYPLNDVKNIFIIKYVKKLGNILTIKDIHKFLIGKIDSF